MYISVCLLYQCFSTSGLQTAAGPWPNLCQSSYST